jgi:cell division protein FtsA
VLAVGGDHISNDLSHGLKVALSRAEQLKIEHGCALPSDEVSEGELVLRGGIGMPDRSLPRRNLHRVMSMRIEETLQLVAQDIEASGHAHQIRTGVFLCGGGARIPRIAELAMQVFEMPVYLGRAQALSGLRSALDQPEFAAPIGLVKFGSIQQQRRSGGSWRKGLLAPLTQIFR